VWYGVGRWKVCKVWQRVWEGAKGEEEVQKVVREGVGIWGGVGGCEGPKFGRVNRSGAARRCLSRRRVLLRHAKAAALRAREIRGRRQRQECMMVVYRNVATRGVRYVVNRAADRKNAACRVLNATVRVQNGVSGYGKPDSRMSHAHIEGRNRSISALCP